jgi:hypothetical protein
MSPIIEDYRIQGPVNTTKLNRKGNEDIRETVNLIGQQSNEKPNQIVFFINESKLSKCPEVEI